MTVLLAIFMSIGNFAGAYFTVVLAFHAFNSLGLRYRQSAWVGVLVVGIGWSLSLALSLAPLAPSFAAKSVSMYGPGNLTCGIQSTLPKAVFLHHLLPVRIKLAIGYGSMTERCHKIFIAALFSAILYSLIYLVFRGSLGFKGGLSINLGSVARWSGPVGNPEEYHRFVLAICQSMLWYVSQIFLEVPR
jgi:hypothetical protein